MTTTHVDTGLQLLFISSIWSIYIHIGGTGHYHVDTIAFQNTCHIQGNIKGYIFFFNIAWTNSTRVTTAMTRVNNHCTSLYTIQLFIACGLIGGPLICCNLDYKAIRLFFLFISLCGIDLVFMIFQKISHRNSGHHILIIIFQGHISGNFAVKTNIFLYLPPIGVIHLYNQLKWLIGILANLVFKVTLVHAHFDADPASSVIVFKVIVSEII